MQAPSMYESFFGLSGTFGKAQEPQDTNASKANQTWLGNGFLDRIKNAVQDGVELLGKDGQAVLTDAQYFLMTPEIKKKIATVKEGQRFLSITAKANIVAAGIFCMLSIAALAAGSPLSIPAIFAGLILLYAGYNAMQVSTNLNPILNFPALYLTPTLPIEIDVPKIKETLSQHTVGFRFVLGKAVDFSLKSHK